MMQQQVIIRRATIADAAMIADLSRRTFFDAFAAENTQENMDKFMQTSFSREKLIAEVAEPANIFFILEVNGILTGYVKLSTAEIPETFSGKACIELCRIYTLQETTSRGLGTRLMNRSIQFAQESGMEILWLGVWEHNLRAVSFYQKNGFEKFGEHAFILGDDRQTDWLMWRKV